MTDPIRISKDKLEMGQVAKIHYKKVNGDVDDYYVFVLNPKFNNYFHCLDLKHIHPASFFRLAEDFNEIVSSTNKINKLDLTKLNLNVNAKNFYLTEIKNNTTLKLKNGYRTFIHRNVSTVTIYNYKYGIFDRVDTAAQRRLDSKLFEGDANLRQLIENGKITLEQARRQQNAIDRNVNSAQQILKNN